MKVAYITNYDSQDVTKWSGTGYYIAESLQRQGVELVRINCSVHFSFFQKAMRKAFRIFSKKLLLLERETSYLTKLARKAKYELAKVDYDIILAPGSLPVSYLKVDKPIVVFTDATYDSLMRLYMQDYAIATRSQTQGNRAEAAALQNASLVIYTSEWAKESAFNKYNVPSQKMKFSYLGANMNHSKTIKDVNQLVHQRLNSNKKQFLFIGVDWYRKGAEKAIETVGLLNEYGIEAAITMVGCKIPFQFQLPSFVKHYPFISKANDSGSALLNKLFEEADYFILPTIADCSPVVFSEAASYGLPVITTNAGGCSSIVRHNETGFCFQPEYFVESAVGKIMELVKDSDKYKELSMNAFALYTQELNWDIVGKKTLNYLNHLVHKN